MLVEQDKIVLIHKVLMVYLVTFILFQLLVVVLEDTVILITEEEVMDLQGLVVEVLITHMVVQVQKPMLDKVMKNLDMTVVEDIVQVTIGMVAVVVALVQMEVTQVLVILVLVVMVKHLQYFHHQMLQLPV